MDTVGEVEKGQTWDNTTCAVLPLSIGEAQGEIVVVLQKPLQKS